MASKLEIIMLEMPDGITMAYVQELIYRVRKMDHDSLSMISDYLNLSEEDVDIDDHLTEEDLFNLDKDDLKVKINCANFIVHSIKEIILPLIGREKTISTNYIREDVSIIRINNKEYLVAADTNKYYTKSKHDGYSYLRALNISGLFI